MAENNNLIPTSRIETYDIEIGSMQSAIEERLAKDGICAAYLWNTGVKRCELGLKFPEEDLSLELFKKVSDKGFDISNPTEFLRQVLILIYNLNVIKVIKESPKMAKLYAEMPISNGKKEAKETETK